MSYKFTMPWPPSVNGYWRTFKNRQIISKRGRHYRDCAIQKLEDLGLCGEGVGERLSVSLVLNPPTLRKYDVDNFCKGLFDAISKSGFWLDDEQIDFLTIKKGEKLKGGNIEVSIEFR
ncbi:MAG: RusA family crossover junction endodeoxyribonuclease [Colwellia sp.]|nr:RusA family crossover junction endodeoxyribonuclease [Colwellia sp.]